MESETQTAEPAEEPRAEEPRAEEPTGKEPTGKEPTGKEPTGKEPTGKEPTGEEPTGEEQAMAPQPVKRWAQVLVLVWGIVVCVLTLPLIVFAPCYLLIALLFGGDRSARAPSVGLAALLVVGAICGGTMALQSTNASRGWPSRRLRLPPLWMAASGFALALAIGLGLWQVEYVAPLLAPWFIVAAAALPPLAAVAWAVGGQPGHLTWRRAGVAFSAAATVSVPLAILLEILVPYAILRLLLRVSEPVLDAIGDLVGLLAGGEVARTLTSPGFLVALFGLAVVAPLVEELVKPLVVLPLLGGLKSRRDAFLLGAAAGAGFAVLENVGYALASGDYWGGVLVVRALGAAVHPLGAGLAALAWHALLNRGREADRRWVAGFAPAVGLHALWNGGLALWLALSGATFFGPKPWETDVLGVSIAAGLLALIALEGAALWTGMQALSRRLLDPAAEMPTVEISTERAVALWAIACLVVLLPVGLVTLRALWLR